MKKRGQFFLIAALIIISIIMGFNTVYNSASANKPDIKATKLAETIKYEATQVINSGYMNNKKDQILNNINSLIKSYAQSNPDVEINIIEEDSDNTFSHKVFQDNKPNQPDIKVGTISKGNNKITVTLSPGLSYTFDNTAAVHDLYVIVKKEGNDERFIAAR
ncbi:hypothetical protein HYW75_02345 [Candidatus Pacearchaeota archaeon]|nr:hypothetical protein [Candidatus Pacearchaeota archaeon]